MNASENGQDPVRVAPPDFLVSEAVRLFWSHMRDLYRERQRIAADDFDMMAVHRLAPNLTLLDIDPGSGRLKVRFVGTAIVSMFGRETTGCWLDEIDLGPFKNALLGAYRDAGESGIPQWTLSRVTLTDESLPMLPQDRHFSYERLVVPLLDDEDNVSRLAAILVRHRIESVEDGFQIEPAAFGED